jgi:hypothetical protein
LRTLKRVVFAQAAKESLLLEGGTEVLLCCCRYGDVVFVSEKGSSGKSYADVDAVWEAEDGRARVVVLVIDEEGEDDDDINLDVLLPPSQSTSFYLQRFCERRLTCLTKAIPVLSLGISICLGVELKADGVS